MADVDKFSATYNEGYYTKNEEMLRAELETLRTRVREMEQEYTTKLWHCDACGFGFDACHENEGGGYSCPLCKCVELEATLATARAAARDEERDWFTSYIVGFRKAYFLTIDPKLREKAGHAIEQLLLKIERDFGLHGESSAAPAPGGGAGAEQ